MGWPFSSSNKTPSVCMDGGLRCLTVALNRLGVTYSVAPVAPTVGDNWLETPPNFGSQAELVSFLSQLEEEGFAQWQEQELILPWPAFYELACNRDYQLSLIHI